MKRLSNDLVLPLFADDLQNGINTDVDHRDGMDDDMGNDLEVNPDNDVYNINESSVQPL